MGARWRWARRVSPLRWVILIISVAHVAPVWTFRYFPTQDGPAHVQNAVILRKLVTGDPEIAQDFHLNRRPVPNWTGHAILAGLSGMFSPRSAEKLLVSIYVIGLPLAAAYAGRNVRRGGEWIGLLALPFVYSLALHKGLYNFCLSLVLFFLILGYAIRHVDSLRRRDALALMVLSLLLYFSHVISLGMAYAVLASIGMATLIARWRERSPLPWRSLMILIAAMLPALALVGWFFLTTSGEATDHRPVGVQLLRFFELDALASFRRPELPVAILFSGVIWLIVIGLILLKTVRRSWNIWDGLLLVALVLTIIYVLAPNTAAGGGQISFRLSLYPYFVLLLWIAAQPIAIPHTPLGVSAAIAASLLFMGVRWGAYRSLDHHLAEYVSVGHAIERNSSVVAIDVSRESEAARRLSWRVRPFWHAMGYLAAERNLFDFGNYEQKMGYFPVIAPGIWSITSGLAQDKVTDDERYAMGTPAQYVVVWSLEPEKTTVSAPTAARLRAGYDVVYTSAPRGLATVYRRKAVPPAG